VGANENTTITFSDPVTVEGQPLDKGAYGLYAIPGENQWTLIFSKTSTAWGLVYKQEDDALRVTVKPQVAEFHDALAYDFDEVKLGSAAVTMRWDKIGVPFNVAIKVNDIVEASFQRQMHGIAQFYWERRNDAAGYLLANKINLDEALKDEDQSIQLEERFDNLIGKSRILDAMGRKDAATELRNKALDRANAPQLYGYGRQLQGDKRQEEAFALYRSNARKFPDDWNSHLGLARVYSGQGDFDNAVKEMKEALTGAPGTSKSTLEIYVKRLQAKDDINR
jgi:tetratricopeptide (TPR) repeat protein